MTIIDKALKAIEPYKDKVFLNPLSDEEVALIQSNYNKKLPNYFVEFLKKVGIKQDFVWDIIDNISRFDALEDFLPSTDYFQFGDRAEDYWLLKFDDNDQNIYEYDYYNEGRIKPLGKTFEDLLFEAVDDIKNRYNELIPNHQKDWCVEFHLYTSNARFIEKELSKYLNIKLLKDFNYKENIPNDESYKGEIEIEGEKIILSKSKFRTGNSMISFDYREPVNRVKGDSMIKKIDEALLKCVFPHGLADYGILNRKDLENDENE